MRYLQFEISGFKEYQDWVNTDRKIANKIGT